MPRERINDMPRIDVPTPNVLDISWNKIGWVQAIVYPPAGEGFAVDLNANNIDKLVKALKKAKRQAYGNGISHPGFEPYGRVVSGPTYHSDPSSTVPGATINYTNESIGR